MPEHNNEIVFFFYKIFLFSLPIVRRLAGRPILNDFYNVNNRFHVALILLRAAFTSFGVERGPPFIPSSAMSRVKIDFGAAAVRKKLEAPRYQL